VPDARTREHLASLAHALGAPERDLAVAGEGNVSAPTGRGTILVSASGSRLAELTPAELVEVAPASLVEALDLPLSDPEWLELIMQSRADPSAARPTVEVALHAVIASIVGDGYIAHTHPTDVLAVLCSGRTAEFAVTRFFPDHIVLLGVADAVVPYVDPGRELAAAVRDALLAHRDRHGEWPRVVLAENHGIFVIASSAREALDRTLMAVKAARIFMSGPVVGLTASAIERIAGREDENYRRSLLAN
jgi:rhamnose utilization protein RhaD (predicted bifunctional aldolase and dehydrogenase)